ncbi:hypothetical protein HK104_002047 [Borealophlyctis nickersoniae]|nr:hypothetical protein HK104_002047 [Borealophlyctis nickersoniae]
MDDILTALEEEVALEGEAGAPPIPLDAEMKAYLWRHLVPRKDIEFVLKTSKGKGKAKATDQDEAEDGEATSQKGVSKDDLALMTPDDVTATYGDRLRVMASQDRRLKAILSIYDPCAKVNPIQLAILAVLAKHRRAGVTQLDLAKILKIDPRSIFHYIKALVEYKLIVKFPLVTKGSYTNLCVHMRFAESNRSYLEYLKKADEVRGTSVHESPLAHKPILNDPLPDRAVTGTGVSYHSELVKQRLTQLLFEAKHNVMVVQDLMDELKINTATSIYERKWFNRMLDSMVKQGYIERVNVPKRQDGRPNAKRISYERCVRLQKLFIASSVANPAGGRSAKYLANLAKAQTTNRDGEKLLGEGGVLTDLPLEWQVYRLIVLAGEEGATAAVSSTAAFPVQFTPSFTIPFQTIQRALNNVGSRLLNRILCRLIKPDDAPAGTIGATRVAEFVGRERRYRYYSADAYNRMMSSEEAGASLGAFAKINKGYREGLGPVLNHEDENLEMEQSAPPEDGTDRDIDGTGTPAATSTEELVGTPQRRTRRKTRSTKPLYMADLTEGEEDPHERESSPDPVADVACAECHQDKDEDSMLLCDHCDKGMHTYCAKPPLERIPDGDWFCSQECRNKGKAPPRPKPSAKVTPKSPRKPKKKVAMDVDDDNTDDEYNPGKEPEDHDSEPEDDEESEGEENSGQQGSPKTPTKTARSGNSQSKPVVITPHTGMKGGYNRFTFTAFKRQQYIAMLLEEKKILEVGYLLIKTYQELVATLQPDSPEVTHTIDKKTLLRTAKAMEAAGKLRVYTVQVPQLNGGYASRVLLLHKSLKPSDPEVQEYIEMMTDRHVLAAGTLLPKQIEVLRDVELERPSDKKRKRWDSLDAQQEGSPGWDAINGVQHLTGAVGSGPSGIMPGPSGLEPQLYPPAFVYPNEYVNSLPVGSASQEGLTDDMHTGSASVSGTDASGAPSTDTTSYRRKRIKVSEKQDPSSPEFWLVIAQQYGYISAKMLRTRYLHEWLVERMLRRSDDASETTPASIVGGPYKNGGAFQTSVLYRDLPFHMFLKCIGHFSVSPAIDEFMKQPGFADTKIGDVPLEVRREIFGIKNKYRKNLKVLLDIMKALGILSPMPRIGPDGHFVPTTTIGDARASMAAILPNDVHPSYRLEYRVPLHDHATDPSRIVRYYVIDSATSLNIYWINLEYLCSQRDVKRWKALDPEPEGAGGVAADPALEVGVNGSNRHVQRGILGTITNVRNWRAVFPYSAAHRKILDPHVNSETGETPLRNETLCRALAEEAGLSLPRVQFYFKKAEEKYQRQKGHKAEMQRKRELAAAVKRQQNAEYYRQKQERQAKREQERRERRKQQEQQQQQKQLQIQRLKAARISRSAAEPAVKAVRKKLKEKKLREIALKESGLEERGKARETRGRPAYRNTYRSQPTANRVVASIAEGIEEHDDEQIPIIADEDRFQDQYEAAAKRNRPTWTPEEDEILLHSHAIIHNRPERFGWTPIGNILKSRLDNHTKPTELCRRRMNTLLKSPQVQDRVNFLVAQWPRIKDQGIADNAFDPQEKVPLIELDLSGMVPYFRKVMGEMTRKKTDPAPLIYLPPRPEQVFQLYDFSAPVAKKAVPQPTEFEDELGEKATTRQRMAVLYGHAFGARVDEQGLVDQQRIEAVDEITIERQVVKTLIKMILMTPEKDYNPQHAFEILQGYPNESIKRALQELKVDQSVVSKKGASDRSLPGRGFQLSVRFLAAIAGTLPDRLLPQAVGFTLQLSQDFKGGPVKYSPFTTSGGMCALLDQVSSGAVTATPQLDEMSAASEEVADEDAAMPNAEVVLQPTAQFQEPHPLPEATRKRSLPEDGQDDDNAHTAKRLKPDGDRREMDASVPVAGFGRTPEEVLCATPLPKEEDRVCIRAIYEIIKSGGVAGVSENQIKAVIAPFGITQAVLSHSLDLLRNTFRFSDLLPLVERVGFDDHRYIIHEHLHKWTIVTKKRVAAEPLDGQESFVHGHLTPARLWYDINGNRVDSVVRACMEAVMGEIMQNPGTYESKLHRKFSPLMTRAELREILQMLVDRGACRRKYLIKPKPAPTLFDDIFNDKEKDGFSFCGMFLQQTVGRCIRADSSTYPPDDSSDHPDKITCYWSLPGWYNKTMDS